VGSAKGSPINRESFSLEAHGVEAGLEPYIFVLCNKSIIYLVWDKKSS